MNTAAARWTSRASWVAVLLAAAPLVVTRPLFLQDWPNHIARIEIVASLLRGEPFWRSYYTLNGPFVPNMALDLGLVAPTLLGLPPDVASSLFLVFTYALVISGGVALARAFGTYDRTTPLLLVLLFYGGTLFYGLVNYLVGLGAMLWVLALWQRARSPRARCALSCIGTAAVFFAHLITAVLLVMLILSQEAWAIWRAPHRGRATLGGNASGLAALIVLGGLAALSTVGQGGPTGAIIYTDAPSIPAMLLAKAIRVVHTLVDGGGLIGAGMVLLGLAAWVAAIILGGRLRLTPAGGILISVPALLFLVSPEKLGEAGVLDYRMVIVAMLLAVTTMRIAWRSRPLAMFAWGLLMFVVLGRTVVVAAALAHRDDTLTAFERAVPVMPRDSMLLTAFGTEHIPWAQYWNPPTIMLAARAARAGVFVPSVFALRSQHTLVLREPYRQFAPWRYVDTPARWAEVHQRLQPVCADWGRAHAGGVFMLVAYPSAEFDQVVPASEVRASGPGFRLVDVCRS